MSKFKKLYNYPIDWDGDIYNPLINNNNNNYNIYFIIIIFLIFYYFISRWYW